MTPELKRLRAKTDRAIEARVPYGGRSVEISLAIERAAWEALLRDIIHAAGAVVQEARHHELMPWLQRKIAELERATTIGGSMTPREKIETLREMREEAASKAPSNPPSEAGEGGRDA